MNLHSEQLKLYQWLYFELGLKYTKFSIAHILPEKGFELDFWLSRKHHDHTLRFTRT